MEKFKHLKVYEETHRKIKTIAHGMGMSIQELMKDLADKEAVHRGVDKLFELNKKNNRGDDNAVRSFPKL